MTTETPPPPKPRNRRRLTLSLRTLMVLVLIVGGGVGWKVSRAKHQRKVLATLGQLGAMVQFDYEYSDGKPVPKGRPWAPAWLRKFAGDEYFREITGVDFSSCSSKMKDADLSPLLGLDRLESVDLQAPVDIQTLGEDEPDGEVGDAGLAYLERSPRLRTLNLSNTRVTDAGLARLARLDALEEVELDRTKVTTAGLAHLLALKTLRKLTLNIKSSTDEGLALVAGPGRLQGLVIRGPGSITEAGWAHLPRLTDLRELEITSAPVSDGTLALIKKLPALRALRVMEGWRNGTTISDAGLAQIGEMIGLEELELWLRNPRRSGVFRHPSPSITDAGLVPIGKLPRLRKLSIHSSSITDDGLSRLRGLTGLSDLRLRCGRITDAGLAHLEGMNRLETLDIWGGEIADAGLVHLHKMTNLKFLMLQNTRVSNAGVVALKGALPTLLDANCFGSRPPLTPTQGTNGDAGQGGGPPLTILPEDK